MTLQEFYEYILHSNLISFLVMIWLLGYICKKCKINEILDKMAFDIKNNVMSSTDAVSIALREYKSIKKEAKSTDAKKEDIINNAKSNIKKIEEKNIEDISKKKAELDNNAEKMKNSSYTKAVQKTANEVQNTIYELSIDAIKLNLNPELQNKLIDISLNELEGLK